MAGRTAARAATISMAMADAAPDAARWPNLARYLDFQRARPTVAPLLMAADPAGRTAARAATISMAMADAPTTITSVALSPISKSATR